MPLADVLAAAKAWTARLHQDHPEVVRVGYFGSYARGDYVPGSDLDVLLELRDRPPGAEHSPQRRAERGLPYRPASFPVGVDLFVYTSAELAALRAAGAAFIATIDREIRWLPGGAGKSPGR